MVIFALSVVDSKCDSVTEIMAGAGKAGVRPSDSVARLLFKILWLILRISDSMNGLEAFVSYQAVVLPGRSLFSGFSIESETN